MKKLLPIAMALGMALGGCKDSTIYTDHNMPKTEDVKPKPATKNEGELFYIRGTVSKTWFEAYQGQFYEVKAEDTEEIHGGVINAPTCKDCKRPFEPFDIGDKVEIWINRKYVRKDPSRYIDGRLTEGYRWHQIEKYNILEKKVSDCSMTTKTNQTR